MRPTTDAELAKALMTQAAYAQDSEARWLMETAAKRLGEIGAAAPIADAPGIAPAAAAEIEASTTPPLEVTAQTEPKKRRAAKS